MAPLLGVIDSQSVRAGTELTVPVTASDPNSQDSFTFVLDPGAPPAAGIDPVTGVFRWNVPATQPAGEYVVTVRVTDSGSPPLSSSRNFTIHVSDAVPVDPPRDTTPPRIEQVEPIVELCGRRQRAVIVGFRLHASEPLDPVAARRTATYQIATVGRRPKTIPVQSVRYDPTTRTVEILTRRPLKSGPYYRVTALASMLTDLSGNRLDGDGDGSDGDDFVTVVGGNLA